ncbi:MAG: CDP-diacylglycerol--glycerol-3-phosphate 3-phosphatidyltransferase [Clostridia bacterium]|nr:CDP-diacylglycerol--glycerol-3-phosphate 3-phosphatidyltransferase [Clostridia bacterium]
MNLPNRLTLVRIVATPIFMYTMVADFAYHTIVAMVVFIAAALTDMLDGQIARSRGLVTDFGKFLDPLADKMLTTAAFLGFLYMRVGNGVDFMRETDGIVWVVFIILFREFAVTSMRLVCSAKGKVVAANMWGKAKTVVQMATIITIFAIEGLKDITSRTNNILSDDLVMAFEWVKVILLLATAVLTVVSGIIYIWQNREALDPSK